MNEGPESMRIVHMLKHGRQGNGSVHVAVDLACAQADRGHEVWFAAAECTYADIMRAHGVRVVDVPEPASVRSAFVNFWRLLRLSWRVRPDVLHAHMMSAAVLGYAVTKLSRPRLIATMHNSFDGHSWLMRLGRVVVAVSEAERELLISRRFNPNRLVTVSNGVGGSAREEQPNDDIGELSQPSIMTLCGLHPRKAVNDVIDAFGMVAAEFPTWQLNVVGWGPELANLERQAEELGLADRVHFLGSTLTPWPLLASTQIFATGTLAEPCGLNVMEARVAGRAIVATNVGGIPETLEGGAAGVLVPPHDPPAMADAFRELLSDPEVLAGWQRRAADDTGYFSVGRMADGYDDVYRWMLGRAPRPSGAGIRRPKLAPVASATGPRTKLAYFVAPSAGQFAGIERVVHEIATALSEEHGDVLDVHVIYASDYQETLLADVAYHKHVLGVERLFAVPLLLRRAVRQLRPDIMIFPQVEASTVGWLATRGLGVPVFLSHLHGNPRVEEHGGTLRSKLAFTAFRHLVSKRIAAILAVSPSLARAASRELSRGAPVVFAKNPVRQLNAAARLRRDDGVTRFVCVARLSWQKGQDVLLRALAIARDELGPVRLALVGSGQEEYVASLRALAAELEITDIVEFVGYVSDPSSYLTEADCFVLPSRWEGFGVALAEALQFGLPLVATDCDFGPADLIVDPVLGEVVEVEDPVALAGALVRASRREDSPDADAIRRAAAVAYLPGPAVDSHFEVLQRLAATHGRDPRFARLAAKRAREVTVDEAVPEAASDVA